VPTEDAEQLALATWLDLAGMLWCHVPNGGARAVQYRAKLRRLGLKPGVPDILIFDPPPKHPWAPGCAVELKRVKGGRTSPEQVVWLAQLEARGWRCLVAPGAEAAILWLSSAMGYPRR
jgi:hypothetical protein